MATSVEFSNVHIRIMPEPVQGAGGTYYWWRLYSGDRPIADGLGDPLTEDDVSALGEALTLRVERKAWTR